MKIAAALLSHDDAFYLIETIQCLKYFDASVINTSSGGVESSSTRAISSFLFISRIPWHNQPGDWQAATKTAESLGITITIGDWGSEFSQRQAAIEYLTSLGFTHALIPDTDEIIEPQLLQTLVKIAENELADRVYVHWDTYGSGLSTYTFDSNGNLTKVATPSGVTTMSYDIENRLSRHEAASVITSYTYQGSNGLKRSEQV